MTSDDSIKQDTQSFHFIVRSGLAGGFAGCVAKTVVAPLDRVKILFQASNPDFRKYTGSWSGAFRAGAQIYRDNGMRGLLQGHSATLLRIFPYAAIKFMAYDQVEQILMPTHEKETNLRRFSAGAISGTISVFVTYPLELIRVRMAYQTNNISHSSSAEARPSFLRVMSKIYREGSIAPVPAPGPTPFSTIIPTSTLFTRLPILKFYRGFIVTIAGMIPYAGTSFLVWGALRSYLLPPSTATNPRPKPSTFVDLGVGAFSGALSQTVSYPFEVVRRRMQIGGLTRPGTWLRFGETVEAIWTTQGMRGFYVGLSVGYLKIVPMTAVSFTVWQWGKRTLGV